MDNTISPILQARITQTNTNNSGNIQRKPDLTTKSDSVELSAKPKMSKGKKALIIAGAVVGAAAVTAGVIALIYKGQIKSIQKEGVAIQEKAQKVVDEFMEKFKNVQPLEDGSKVIEEFAQDGKTLARKATLDVDDFLEINDYANKTRIEAKKGVLDSFFEKIEFFKDGGFKCKKVFFFTDGKVDEWQKNYQINADGSWSFKTSMVFEDEKLSSLSKNHQGNADGSWSEGKSIDFKDGKLYRFCKNYQENTDGSWSVDREIKFKDGKLSTLAKNYQENADRSCSTDKVTCFENGKISQIQEKFQKNADGSCSADKITYFENGKKVETERNATW